MKNKTTVGITACSDALDIKRKEQVESLEAELIEMGCTIKKSPYLFANGTPFSTCAEEKGRILNDLFRDGSVRDIFDISGGDLANEVIPYIDIAAVSGSNARFWGYSDLTSIINAIYAKTGRASVLYQVRNILEKNKEKLHNALIYGDDELFCPPVSFVNGEEMSGVLVGGNIRCFLKLAGTEYFPDVTGKIVILESLGGGEARICSMLTQLEMLGVFEKASGVLLGTFTELFKNVGNSAAIELISDRIMKTSPGIPIAFTELIGHGKDSFAVLIGKYAVVNRENGKVSYL